MDIYQFVRQWPALLMDDLRAYHHQQILFSGNKDVFQGNCAHVKSLPANFSVFLRTCATVIVKFVRVEGKTLEIYKYSQLV